MISWRLPPAAGLAGLHVKSVNAAQSGSCSLAVSSMAYAGVDAPPLPLDAGPAIVNVAIRHAGQFATNVHPVSSHMAPQSHPDTWTN